MSKEEVKFPFEVNETVKATFRNANLLNSMIELMTKALLAAASESDPDPWTIVLKEYPELRNCAGRLQYIHATGMIDLKGGK